MDVDESIGSKAPTMEPTKTFIITNDLRVVFTNFQLDTKIYIMNTNGNSSVCLDVDKFTELMKAFNSIEKEFYNRFKYQLTNI